MNYYSFAATMVKMLKKCRHLLRIRDNTSEFKHIVGFTSDLK
jgi:hypothetical protein